MPKSQDLIVENRMMWQQCFVQLVVGVSAFAGTAVLLVQVLPPLARPPLSNWGRQADRSLYLASRGAW
jgi:hypothetical protein